MNQTNLEYALSRRLDGPLPSDEAAAVDRILSENPAARREAERYRRVDELVKSLGSNLALPAGVSAADLEASADRIARRIEAWEMDGQGAVAGRIGPGSAASSWRIGPWITGAAAAAVAGAVGLTLFVTSAGPARPTVAFAPVAPPVPVVVSDRTKFGASGGDEAAAFVAVVAPPTSNAQAGPAVARVEVGPPAGANRKAFQFPLPSAVDRSMVAVAADVVPRQSRIIIAAAPIPAPRGGPY